MAEVNFAPHGQYEAGDALSKDTSVTARGVDSDKFQAEVTLHYHNVCQGIRRMPLGDPVNEAGKKAVQEWATGQGTFEDILSKANTPEGLKRLETGLRQTFDKYVMQECYRADGVEIRSLSKP